MERDILILTVYFICMGYVVYQMALSIEEELEDQVTLVPDSARLEDTVRAQVMRQGFAEDTVAVLATGPEPLKKAMTLQLSLPEPRGYGPEDPDQNTMGKILVQVLPQGPHPLKPLPSLTVQVVNQSRAIQTIIDWDRSSFSRMNGDIRRVIRQTPGQRLDLTLPQVASAINPNQFLSTAIAAEDSFERDSVSQVLKASGSTVDIPKLAEKEATYALDLVVQLIPFSGRGGRPVMLLLPFHYQVQMLPAKAAIPMVNWILKR